MNCKLDLDIDYLILSYIVNSYLPYPKNNPLQKKSEIRSVYLFGKLFFTELVQGEEFLGKGDVLLETTGGKFDTDDDSSVRNHHSHGTEINLQVLR